ncbi:alanine racemase [Heliophilum fasciatum]|uniref:Alanine racemase n=1 Tax=Heliophilum fasciatum TaxID=35700 RepID=A0A4R2RMD5_9FIRM|nr:alanine racemase [Heliophilum fasciatum]MCW2278094.1 alanine racemase [Heliophilum fasciatum]TCP64164.1 alanine racemase [Heliophilum fasciatum]
MERPVWADVDLAAIAANVRNICQHVQPSTQVMAVVKANGYGHGAVPVAKAALDAGATYLGVALLSEVEELRGAGITAPILILGYTPPELAGAALATGAALTVFDLPTATAYSEAAQAAGKTLTVHLKVDTGMGRIGVLPEEAGDLAAAIARLPGLDLEGIFSHFAASDSRDKSYAHAQWAAFQQVLAAVAKRGIRVPIRHIANSAAILEMPETHLDMVRAGIILYGLQPSDEVTFPFPLAPAMELKARIAHLKTVPAGTAISYGCTFRTARESVIATLPIGYADGWIRLMSNCAHVLVRGRRVPLVGRVCMDQCMIDVTDVPAVSVGDEAVLFGRQGGEFLSVDEVARHAGTINYETVCLVSYRVPRHYHGAGKSMP